MESLLPTTWRRASSAGNTWESPYARASLTIWDRDREAFDVPSLMENWLALAESIS